MAEIGSPMEVQKRGIGQKLREAFTPKGAEQKWVRDHAEDIRKMADLSKELPDEEKMKVMMRIEDSAKKAANRKVLMNWGGVALTGATLGFGGALVKSERFRTFLDNKGGPVGGWLADRGWSASVKLEEAGEKLSDLGQRAKDGLKTLWEKRPWNKPPTPVVPVA